MPSLRFSLPPSLRLGSRLPAGMPPRRRELVVETLSRAADFRIDIAQEALAPDIGDEGGVDRCVFDVEAAALEPSDQPFAMTARLGEAKQTKQVVVDPRRVCRSTTSRRSGAAQASGY
jgi:hypothetical protein